MSQTEIKKLDLGILSPTSKIFVSCLPKEAASAVVKYDFGGGIRVSCVVPPQTMHVRVNQQSWNYGGKKRIKKCKLKTPTLLLTMRYSDTPAFGRVLVQEVSIFAMDETTKERIKLKPYLLSNAYSNGLICWGSLPIPWDLKSSFNTFWGSTFTEDLGEPENELDDDFDEDADYDLMTRIKRYHKHILVNQEYADQTEFICGKKFWAAPRGADGILITSNPSLLKQIPPRFWLKASLEDSPKICALAYKKDDLWKFESGRYEFGLPKDSVTIQPNHNKTLDNAKKAHNMGDA